MGRVNSTEALQPAPRVSVVVPLYNGAQFIERVVGTVCRQTCRDLELVLVDDGSSDDTAARATRFAAEDQRIRLIRQANRGLAAARNAGVRAAHGELLAFLDQDDLWLPEKLALQVAYIDAHPLCAMVSCFSALVDDDARLLGWPFGERAEADAYRQLLQCDVVAGGSVALVRSEAVRDVGGFDEDLPERADWELWIRLARRFELGTVSRVLVGYTRSTGNMSSDLERMAAVGERVLNKAFAADPSLGARFLRRCRARDRFAVACFALVDGRPRAAWRYVRASAAITPVPMMVAPRRWVFLAALVLASVLPRRAFALAFGLAARFAGLTPGAPLSSLETAAPCGESASPSTPPASARS